MGREDTIRVSKEADKHIQNYIDHAKENVIEYMHKLNKKQEEERKVREKEIWQKKSYTHTKSKKF